MSPLCESSTATSSPQTRYLELKFPWARAFLTQSSQSVWTSRKPLQSTYGTPPWHRTWTSVASCQWSLKPLSPKLLRRVYRTNTTYGHERTAPCFGQGSIWGSPLRSCHNNFELLSDPGCKEPFHQECGLWTRIQRAKWWEGFFVQATSFCC